MRDTYISIERNGLILKRHIPVQVDQASDREAVEYKTHYGFEGRDVFTIITLGWNPTALIQRADTLIDEKYKDEYGNAYRYNVEGLPKNYDGSHQHVLAGAQVGN